ncbi:DUF4968 domain-containing protein [Catenovulum sp. SM1970]|uniref:glycoside hydrolase family 31 protein n=1 Tax=Marinifaba aquimaris TaxID=2741323 RepID=UPI001572202E|nr:TIM-barrel domain-containing protein [Marinifaba aquimaris]NTS77413.1 DUF4968 domain-containing protein [Marinifaba aquimaris]
MLFPRLLGIALIFIFSTGLLEAREYLSHQVVDSNLIVKTDQGEVKIKAIHSQAMEVLYQKVGVKNLPSFSLIEQKNQPQTRLKNNKKELVFTTSGLTAVITKSPFNIAFYRDQELLIAEELGFFSHTGLLGFRFKVDEDEKFLGGGQRVLGMDRRGHRIPLYNRAHYGYETESNQMNYSLPALMSSKKYLVLFDNTAKGAIDIAHAEKNIVQFEAVGGRSSYVIATDNSYSELVSTYTDLTGKQPLLPRWALGNFASRFGYRNEAEARNVVKMHQAQDFPLDAIIFDLYWFGPDIQGHMGNLDWDRNAFPTPEKMIKDFKNDGIKTVLISEPFILTTSSKWDSAVQADALGTNLAGDPKVFNFYFGETGLVDVFNDQGRDWFWSQYQPLLEQGVEGWWGDLGEPEVHPHDMLHTLNGQQYTADELHNVYGHEWAKLVYQQTLKVNPQKRPFILMRAGFAGSQRYGLIPWTGDVNRTWGGLKPQVELALQMGMFGLGYIHSDLGGFAGGDSFDKELYIRWLQYGVFQPIYRPHAQEHIAPEPVFHDKETQDIVRNFIKLRYQLLPYNYTLAYQNATQGTPLMRPLFFIDETKALIDYKDAYLWGDAFLVAPVTDAGATKQMVKVPQGVWFDYWSGQQYQGKKGGLDTEIAVTLETIPVLVKAGSFVPQASAMSSTEQYDTTQLILDYYHDSSVKNSRGVLYHDDGITPYAEQGQANQKLNFTATFDQALTISLAAEHTQYDMPNNRQLTLTIKHWNQPISQVKVHQQNTTAVLQCVGTKLQTCYQLTDDGLTVFLNWNVEQATDISIHPLH